MLDRIAIGLSGLCIVHCLATTLFLAVLASAGSVWLHPIVHEAGLTLAIILGALTLLRGAFSHGYLMPAAVGALGLGVMAGAMTLSHDGPEAIYTIVGVGLLALGHDLNRRAAD